MSANEATLTTLRPLTQRERRFVEEYLVDLSTPKAAVRAGYAASTAEHWPFLSQPHIRAAVDQALAERTARTNVTADRVLSETSLLAMSRMDHYYIDDEGQVSLAEGAPPDAMAAVQSIKRKVRVLYGKDGEEIGKEYECELRLWDKPQPLKLLGRHVGLFADRLEVTGAGGGPIQVAAARLAEMPTEELERMALELGKAARAIDAGENRTIPGEVVRNGG